MEQQQLQQQELTQLGKNLSPSQRKEEERWNILTTLIADDAAKLGKIHWLCVIT